MNHEQRLGITFLAQLVPHGRKLDLHGTLKIGIENRGHGSLVFTELSNHLSREDHWQIANVKFFVLVANNFLHPPFVHRIQKTPKQRDHKSARAPAGEIANFLSQVVFVQRPDYSAARVHTLLYADDHVPRYQRIGFVLNGKISALGNSRAVDPLRSPPEQHNVFVAFGGDQPQTRAFLFDQAV